LYRQRAEKEENAIDFSVFRQFSAPLTSNGFSIKYVLQGTERYQGAGSQYDVTAGMYLLTNAFWDCEVTIDSTTDVQGLCMDISPAILAEVMATHQMPAAPYPRQDYYDFLTSASFFEHCYPARHTATGQWLQQTVQRVAINDFADPLFAANYFYELAAIVLADQQQIYGGLCALESVKNSTRKDLLRRLMRGRDLIEDCYTEKLSVAAIAREATMSEYYFIRLFKQVFGVSPYRHALNRRLEMAARLLQDPNCSIAQIAWRCGFSDPQAFSKSFRQQYAQSPLQYQQRWLR
jgi:AraC-like DNA-binding protein